jgi:hypothetical protein
MTLQEFITKWDGKFCEVAGSANATNQCVDLANQFIREVLCLPIIEWTNACDFPSKASGYTFIKNTPENIPLEGDLVIWSSAIGGGAGHIAIFVEGTASRFTSFDQNYPLNTPCHKQGHTYANILGWLHPKETMNMYKGLDLSNPESMKVAVDVWKDVMDKLYVKASEYAQLKDGSETRIKEEAKRYTDFLQALSVKLGVAADEPKILENIAELLVKESNVVTTTGTTHSKLCGWFARHGL